ncbi:60S acidic ribosomal protein P2 [Armadillidium nasatum]|uniref:Large ribosomal subunit protein P2 n=1 Tax=Armadillidium nasatum TaxID=96803 RepID=A0A5N5SY26_9CRUS|nr:60S acidic ribosomal protein P2 [Armadillidium nasatum]
MRYVAAYCLATLGGGEPSAKDLEKILGSVGLDCDAADAKKVVEELKGKKLENVINEAAGVPSAGGGGGKGPAAPKEEKVVKEEKKEEPEEESDEDMGFGLFD